MIDGRVGGIHGGHGIRSERVTRSRAIDAADHALRAVTTQGWLRAVVIDWVSGVDGDGENCRLVRKASISVPDRKGGKYGSGKIRRLTLDPAATGT